MWDPLLQQEIEQAFSADAWKGPGPLGVFCLLDPPKNALPPRDYQAAQKSVAAICRQLQSHRERPMPLGLQDDFWSAAAAELGPSLSGRPASGSLERGGLGIAAAIAESHPPVVRLESAAFAGEYERWKTAAIAAMERGAPFFQKVLASHRAARARHLGPRVRAACERIERYRQGGSLAGHLRWLVETAPALGIDLQRFPERAILDHDRVARHESGLAESEVLREKSALAEEIRAAARPAAIPPRAAAEICLYEILDRFGEDEGQPRGAAWLREILAQPLVLEVPDQVIRDAVDAIDGSGYYLADAIRIRPEDQGRPHRGSAEVISRFLELAVVLGIDIEKYPQLQSHVYAINLHFRSAQRGDQVLQKTLIEAMERIERAVLDKLAASAEERTLLGLDRPMRFLEELGRFHLVYDAGLRRTIVTLDLPEICRTLDRLGAPVAGGPGEAVAIDTQLSAVRELYDRTIVRGKDLASRLVAEMARLEASRAILCCDGYLKDTVAPWLRANHVSYSLLVPRW